MEPALACTFNLLHFSQDAEFLRVAEILKILWVIYRWSGWKFEVVNQVVNRKCI